MIQLIVDEQCPPGTHAEDWDLEALTTSVTQCFGFKPSISDTHGLDRDSLAESLWEQVEKVIDARETEYPLHILMHYARVFYLEEIDQRWIEHLKSMEALREGIHLRGYGQKDPKQEYKKEGFVIFGEMMSNIGRNVCEKLFHMQLQRVDGACRDGARPRGGTPARPRRRRRRLPRASRARPSNRAAAPRHRRKRRRVPMAAATPTGTATPSQSAATSPKSGATIRAPAEAVRNTRNATAPSSRRSRRRRRALGRGRGRVPGGPRNGRLPDHEANHRARHAADAAPRRRAWT